VNATLSCVSASESATDDGKSGCDECARGTAVSAEPAAAVGECDCCAPNRRTGVYRMLIATTRQGRVSRSDGMFMIRRSGVVPVGRADQPRAITLSKFTVASLVSLTLPPSTAVDRAVPERRCDRGATSSLSDDLKDGTSICNWQRAIQAVPNLCLVINTKQIVDRGGKVAR